MKWRGVAAQKVPTAINTTPVDTGKKAVSVSSWGRANGAVLLSAWIWHGSRSSFPARGLSFHAQLQVMPAMLRITRRTANDSTTLLRLEGKLLKPWVEELERSISDAKTPPGGLRLDLSDLTFADAAGAQILADLVGQGATIIACTAYVAALLQLAVDGRLDE